ncbi:unnamed protein product [Brassica rapa subsp. trilocularis]
MIHLSHNKPKAIYFGAMCAPKYTLSKDIYYSQSYSRRLLKPTSGLPGQSHLGGGHWFTLRDLEIATNRFSKENVIGEGGYGVVYRGELTNGTYVAVKNIMNHWGQHGYLTWEARIKVLICTSKGVNLVEWLKMMVGSKILEEVIEPATSTLKRVLLTALRCIDLDSEKRQKMSQVVRVLYSEEHPIPREVSVL